MSARSIGAGPGPYVRSADAGHDHLRHDPKPDTRYPSPATVSLTRRQVFVLIDALNSHELHAIEKRVDFDEVTELFDLLRSLLPPDER